MPSGREKGPEKRSNTRREVSAAACVAAVGARWRGAGNAASQATCEGSGRPGGCSISPSVWLARLWQCCLDGSQGKCRSLK
eukprot:5134278-Pleurochrysis_carterae.AAC.1